MRNLAYGRDCAGPSPFRSLVLLLGGPLILALVALSLPAAAVERLSLDGEWQFRQVGKAIWYPARVPGCVHLDLLENRLIPDPFYRDNELKVQWVENEDWEYRREFEVPDTLFKKPHVELVLEGLDTFAAVYLNGQKVAETNNMFRTYRFDVRPFLQPHQNEIVIRFDSPVRRGKELEAKLPYKLPGGSPHVRKAPYHFGWDWGPRLVTSGIWRPLFLEAWEGARIGEVEIRQDFLEKNRVVLRVRTSLLSDRNQNVAVKAIVSGKRIFAHSESMSIKVGLNMNEKSLPITNPDLWWPAGMGEQNLYTIRVELYRKGVLLDAVEKRIGLRTLVLDQTPDDWGKSFRFVVNGVPFFAKGGNWIPADSFPPRVTHQKYEQLLRDCREANMNMLRVWGGGIYEAPEFYDLCDELGLVIWQDFMFACALFPGDDEFLQNVRSEAEDVLKRLRHHPSIALWCGNNECEEGWFHWGWKEQYPEAVWVDYEKIFHGILPDVVDKLDPRRPYWPSSPHSEVVGQPRSETSGDMHYWGVWHGQEPFTEYRKKFHRFFSEFGFQSFPLLETVKRFALPQDWNIASPVMEQHQKHPAGNRLILLYMLDGFRLPKDFESLLWLSQVQQAEGMKIAVEHFRSQMPRIMGALYWQINDCWPVASWSGTDYFGTWKALHYYARRFFNPVLVAPIDNGENLKVYGISDLERAIDADLYCGVFTYDGDVVQDGETSVRLEPRSSRVLMDKPIAELIQDRPREDVYFYCQLRKAGEMLSSNIFHFTPLKRVDLPEPEIRFEVFERAGRVVVRLGAVRLAKMVYLSAPGMEGRFSDNFFDMVPGRQYEVSFLSPGQVNVRAFKQALKVISLRDSY